MDAFDARSADAHHGALRDRSGASSPTLSSVAGGRPAGLDKPLWERIYNRLVSVWIPPWVHALTATSDEQPYFSAQAILVDYPR